MQADQTAGCVAFGDAWQRMLMQEPKEHIIEKYKICRVKGMNMEAALISLLRWLQENELCHSEQQQIKRVLEGGVMNG